MESDTEKIMHTTDLLNAFRNMQRNLVRFAQKTAADNDLSVPQYSILMAMMHCDETTQKNVGVETLLPKSTLSQAVDGLVRSGLLHRQQLECNRREMQLSLSEKGKLLIKKIHLQKDGIHQVFQHAVESLTEKQYQELLGAYLQMTTYLEEQEGLIK